MRGTLLLGRFLYSMIFIVAGFGHFSDATIRFAETQGVPYAGLLVPLSGLLAIFGGLSILFGYRAKLGAWALVVFLVPVTLMMHAYWTITDPAQAQIQMAMFMKNLSMLGGALTFAYYGSGAYSLDSRTTRSEATPFVGVTTSMAGTVLPTRLRTEGETAAREVAEKANDSSRLTGMW